MSSRYTNNISRRTNANVTKCKTKCQTYNPRLENCVVTNTHISLRDCSNPKKTQYHYITPCELNVDLLQYAFNEGLFKLSKDKKYVSIEKLPTLLVETTEHENRETNNNRSRKTSFKNTRRDTEFFHAYEDIETLKLSPYEEQLKIYLKEGLYKTLVKETNTNAVVQSVQNVNYVKQIAESLSTGEYICDLAGIPPKYIIIEEMNIEGLGEFVICGYPSPSKMRNYLSLLEDREIGTKLTAIHKEQKTQFARKFVQMYNAIYREQPDKQIKDVETEMYKFIEKALNLKYIEKWYEAQPQLRKWIASPDFKEKLAYMDAHGLTDHKEYVLSEINKALLPQDEYERESAQLPKAIEEYNQYINALLLEYLNKPMMRIRYHFLIFKKHPDPNHRLVPAIFNIKQLTPQHKPLLEKIQDLIQVRIPAIFGILEDSRNKLERYKLFHSYVKYGDMFYITTEYLHTMSNILHYAYIYKNSMSLEELIYATSRISNSGNPFWHDLKLEYELKHFRIEQIQSGGAARAPTASRMTTYVNKHSSRYKLNTNWRSAAITSEKIINGQIILIYERTYQEYVIIYIDEKGSIIVMIIKSNMAKCIDDIKNAIKRDKTKLYTCYNSSYRTIQYNGGLFEVKDIHEITLEEFRQILKINPIGVKKYIKLLNDLKIKFSDYFQIQLLPMKPSILLFHNLYNITPILSINHLTNPLYLQALAQSIEKNISIDALHVEHLQLDKREIALFKYDIVDKITSYINIDNCGYNFIIGERPEYKNKVIWVYPYNKTVIKIRRLTDIDEKCLEALKILKTLFIKDSLKYIHFSISLCYFTLHIHSISENNYKRLYPHEDNGLLFLREEHIQNANNKLTCDKKYYLEYNIDILDRCLGL